MYCPQFGLSAAFIGPKKQIGEKLKEFNEGDLVATKQLKLNLRDDELIQAVVITNDDDNFDFAYNTLIRENGHQDNPEKWVDVIGSVPNTTYQWYEGAKGYVFGLIGSRPAGWYELPKPE
jgi:hypothetical protein